MIIKRTNIQEKLNQEKKQGDFHGEALLRQVHDILAEDTEVREKISGTLENGSTGNANNFDFDLLDTDAIFHVEQIKKICIDYRLRFLDTKYFKGSIPPEAISKIKNLEKEHNTSLKGFKIIAPSKLFKLEDKDDPLLFAPIGNGYYYLVHQWGNDLHPMRKLLMWPFKSVVNLGILVFVVSFFLTLLVPDGLFSKSSSTAEFWIIYFFMFKSLAAIVIFYGFALGKNFNPVIWNSKYFNA
jgi:hypothetical protein